MSAYHQKTSPVRWRAKAPLVDLAQVKTQDYGTVTMSDTLIGQAICRYRILGVALSCYSNVKVSP